MNIAYLEQLILTTKNRTPNKIKKLLDLYIYSYIQVEKGDYYACTIKHNYNCYTIHINVIKCKDISENAFRGIIVHEFAEIYNFRRLFGIVNFLQKKKILKHTEKKIDKIAISWGFKKEIEQKNIET